MTKTNSWWRDTWTAAIGALAVAAPAAAAPAKPTVIPLEPYLGQLWSFHAELAGAPAVFLLDTAGGVSVVTPAAAGAAGCRPWGRVTGFRMRGGRLDAPRCDGLRLLASGVPLPIPTASVVDMSTFLPKDAPPLAGSVALDAFAGRLVTLDLAHRRLIVETPASFRARTRRAQEVPARFSRDVEGLALTPLIGVETREGRAWMELDCGSDGAAIVGRHVAPALGLDPDHKGGQDVTLTLAGGRKVATRAGVDDLILDGNIGAPLMRRWVVSFDLARQRVWIADARP